MPRRYQDIDPDTFEAVCVEIEHGKSLVSICKSMKLDYSSFTHAVGNSDELHQRYARAREAQADFLAEEAKDMLDESPRLKADQFGNMSIDPAWVQLQSKRADQRRWHAGKLKPKVYGDSTTVKGDKDNPLFSFADALSGVHAALQKHRGNAPMIEDKHTTIEGEGVLDSETPL